MHVIVVGCGRVGSELAARLRREGQSVAIMDKNANAFRRLPEVWDGQSVVGFGFDRDDLLKAGIERADAVAAVTSGDNTNILTARIARETFEVPNVVARIYDPRRALIYQKLGIATGQITMVEYPLPDSLCGRGLAELADADRFRPVMVTRGGTARLAGANMVGQEGDVIHFAVRTDAFADLNHLLESPGSPAAGRTPQDSGASATRGRRS